MIIKHYSFNGQIIATLRKVGTNDVLRYTHADHLGSTSGQTDTAGNAVTGTYVRHYAYGTVQAGDTSTLNTDRTFTGQKADSTGLLYFNARYYDSALGQFLSPDTLVPNAGVLPDNKNRPAEVRSPAGRVVLTHRTEREERREKRAGSAKRPYFSSLSLQISKSNAD